MRYWGFALLLLGLVGGVATSSTDAASAPNESQSTPSESDVAADETIDTLVWPEVSEEDQVAARVEIAAAKAAFESGDYDLTLAKADAAIARDYTAGEAWVYRGLALEQLGKTQEALEILAAVSGEPEVAESELGTSAAEAEARIRGALAQGPATRGSQCRYETQMSEAETVRYLRAISATISQANACVGSRRKNCQNRSNTDNEDSIHACFAIFEKIGKIGGRECEKPAPGHGFRWAWIGLQTTYLVVQWDQLERDCPT